MPYWKYTGAGIEDNFLPDKLMTRSGRLRTYDGKSEDYPHYVKKITSSRHFTLIFNIFVML